MRTSQKLGLGHIYISTGGGAFLELIVFLPEVFLSELYQKSVGTASACNRFFFR
jgi:hypothetical protein